jgi:hypothetical protein
VTTLASNETASLLVCQRDNDLDMMINLLAIAVTYSLLVLKMKNFFLPSVDCEKQESVLNVKAIRTFHHAVSLHQNALDLAHDNLKLQNVIGTN